MNALQTRQSIQQLLGVTADGIFGPKCRGAFDLLAGTPDDAPWPSQINPAPTSSKGGASPATGTILKTAFVTWVAVIDGDDIVVRNITATCFGGSYDKGDNGQTESGVLDKGALPPAMVALPIRSTEDATKGSPLAFKVAHIPWGTPVTIWHESDGEQMAIGPFPLNDNGPDISKFPTHALDVNPSIAHAFSPSMAVDDLPNKWSMSGISYRIHGAAKFVS